MNTKEIKRLKKARELGLKYYYNRKAKGEIRMSLWIEKEEDKAAIQLFYDKLKKKRNWNAIKDVTFE